MGTEICSPLLVRWFAFIISIVGCMYSYIGVGALENCKPRFYITGLINWSILVAK